MSEKKIVIIYGPTASGKTDFSLNLAQRINGEVINADVGQFYTPLTIGTAKPDWQKSTVPHHLFDSIDEPIDLTVTRYRALLEPLVGDIWARGNTPLIVGGSGFYVASIFFPPAAPSSTPVFPGGQYLKSQATPMSLWNQLREIDPDRAASIHPHDEYRVKRALELWQTTGIKPSEHRPTYQPLGPYSLFFLMRNRQHLYNRIDKRVELMMHSGWIDEVKHLQATAWEPFLKKKKLIGYSEIFDYLQGSQDSQSYQNLVALIAKKTRNYAKRQIIFWRMLKKKLEPYSNDNEVVEIDID